MYDKNKIKLKRAFEEFLLTDDLIKLAIAYITARDLLLLEDFPIEKYQEWLKEQNLK